MGARLEAAKAAIDEVLQKAAAAIGAMPEPAQFQPLYEELVTKARAARAALDGLQESGDEVPPPEPGEEDFGHAALKGPGGPVPYRTEAPKPRERGGPRDDDMAKGVFKKEIGAGSSQIQRPGTTRAHCELCGRLLDIARQDPCPLPDCPHPGPIQPRAA